MTDWFSGLSSGFGGGARTGGGAGGGLRPQPKKGREWWDDWRIWAGAAGVALVVLPVVAVAATWASLLDPRELLALKSGAIDLRYDDGSQMQTTGKRPGPFLQPDWVSDYVRLGFVATEDRRFFEHKGVDLEGIARAFVSNLSGGAPQGGSTITQQLVHIYYFPDVASGKKEPGRQVQGSRDGAEGRTALQQA